MTGAGALSYLIERAHANPSLGCGAVGNDEHLTLLEFPRELHNILCGRLPTHIKGFGNLCRQLIRRHLLLDLTPDEEPRRVDVTVVARADSQKNAFLVDFSPDDVRLSA